MSDQNITVHVKDNSGCGCFTAGCFIFAVSVVLCMAVTVFGAVIF